MSSPETPAPSEYDLSSLLMTYHIGGINNMTEEEAAGFESAVQEGYITPDMLTHGEIDAQA